MLMFVASTQAQDVKIFKDANNKYGLKDSKGAIVLIAKYNFTNDFVVIPMVYDNAGYFSGGLAAVLKDFDSFTTIGFLLQSSKKIAVDYIKSCSKQQVLYNINHQ